MLSLKKQNNFYQVMIFIVLTIRFCAQIFLFIPYSYLDSNQLPSDLK